MAKLRDKKLWLLFTALSMAGLLIVACAPAVVPTPTQPPPKPATPGAATPAAPTPAALTPAAEQPRYGGILTVGNTIDAPGYDIHAQESRATLGVVAPSYSGLIQDDPMEPTKQIPDLAEKWEVSPDGLVYTFHLRKGVNFHDGKPCTSADAKYSIDRIYNPPKGAVSPRAGYLSAIEKVDAPDDYTVKITLKRRQSSFILVMSMGWQFIAPKHIEEKGLLDKQVVGTGPFTFVSHLRESVYEVKKNPDYFVKGRPYLDGIKFYTLRDPATRLAAFKTGRILMVDQANGFTYSQAKVVEKEMKDVAVADRIGTGAGSGAWLFLMPHDKKPWSDLRVRKAVHLALDRQKAIDVIEEGFGMLTGPIPPGPYSFTEDELEKMPGYRQPKDADMAEAKKLMAEAGYPDGFKTKMMLRSGSAYEPAGLLMKDQLAKLGIDASIDVKDTAALFESAEKHGYDSWYFKIGYRLNSDPDEMLSTYYVSTAPRNWTYWKNPRVDQLFEEEQPELDPAKRKQLLLEAQKLVLDEVAVILSHGYYHISGHWKKVRGYKPSINIYNNNKLQDVWLAE